MLDWRLSTGRARRAEPRMSTIAILGLDIPVAYASFVTMPSDSAVPAIADTLRDRYRFERELGAGGMATVYLAIDLKHERPVAVEVLRGGDGALGLPSAS